jgi:autoinducer 2-degrading protein
MFIVHVDIEVLPGRVEDFITATKNNAEASIRESGIARFDFIADQANPAHFAWSRYTMTRPPPRHTKRHPITSNGGNGLPK